MNQRFYVVSEKSGGQMKAEIGMDHPKWPAIYRMAKALGFDPVLSETATESEEAGHLMMLFLKNHFFPKWGRIYPALEEYWECNYYSRYIWRQAVQVQNSDNELLAKQMLRHGYEDLAFKSRESWEELSGLAVQKLRHLSYYETAVAYQEDVQWAARLEGSDGG